MLESILMQFCSKDSTRKQLQTPFNIEDYTYATNGHIAIRIPKDPKYDSNEPIKTIVALMITEQDKNKYITIPEIKEYQEEKECQSCNGTGLYQECPDCEGTGEVGWISDGGYEYENDCRMCDNTGKIEGTNEKCDICNGVGKINKDKIIELIPNVWVNARLLNIVAQIPNAEIAPNSDKYLKAIPFKFNDGIGLIMPCSKPKENS